MRAWCLVFCALLHCATGDEPVGTQRDAAADAVTEAAEVGDAVTETADAETGDTGTLDTGLLDTGPEVGPATFAFPATGDTKTVKVEPSLWNLGDAIEGKRTTGLAAATSLTGTWALANNDLSDTCGLLGTSAGTIPVDVSLNGTVIGSFTVKRSSGLSVPIAFTFAAIGGPTYTLRYQVKATVASGCGSIQTTFDVSKLTLE